MKRLISGYLVAAATCATIGLVGAAPAGANTSCSILSSKPTEFRVCGVQTATVGAEFDGFINWYYVGNKAAPRIDPVGRIDGTVYDTADDGSCAWVRLTHYDAAGNQNFTVQFVKACGKGAHTTINDSADLFNAIDSIAPRYTAGTWKAFLQTNSLKLRLWTQKVDAPQP